MFAVGLKPVASPRPRSARAVLFGLVLVLGACAAPAPAPAGSVLFDGVNVEVEGSYGSGANQTMLVIDWNSGLTPSHAWLYSWSGTTTIHAMLTNLAALLPGAFAYNAPGGFVTGLDYFDGHEQHMGNRAGWMSIWDSAGAGAGPKFKTTPRGVAGMNLLVGGWVGINADGVSGGAWPGPAPAVPLAAPVPEPSGLALLGLGALTGVGLLARRRAA